MPEQMVELISKFQEWLPDMDILLNENDEPRVVIPWSVKQQLFQTEQKSRSSPAEKYGNAWPATSWRKLLYLTS
jgi:hypothetical protein